MQVLVLFALVLGVAAQTGPPMNETSTGPPIQARGDMGGWHGDVNKDMGGINATNGSRGELKALWYDQPYCTGTPSATDTMHIHGKYRPNACVSISGTIGGVPFDARSKPVCLPDGGAYEEAYDSSNLLCNGEGHIQGVYSATELQALRSGDCINHEGGSFALAEGGDLYPDCSHVSASEKGEDMARFLYYQSRDCSGTSMLHVDMSKSGFSADQCTRAIFTMEQTHFVAYNKFSCSGGNFTMQTCEDAGCMNCESTTVTQAQMESTLNHECVADPEGQEHEGSPLSMKMHEGSTFTLSCDARLFTADMGKASEGAPVAAVREFLSKKKRQWIPVAAVVPSLAIVSFILFAAGLVYVRRQRSSYANVSPYEEAASEEMLEEALAIE